MEANGKAVLYARVSTDDGRQDTTNQVDILRDMAQRLGLKITKEYVDHASGGTGDREAFQEMFKDLKNKPGTTLLFFSLDRLTREGATATLNYLEKLTEWNVIYRSATEGWLDSAGPFKEAIISIMATLAKMEKIKIGERTRAGLARVKKEGTRSGKPIGRAPVMVDLELARELVKTEGSIAAAARKMGLREGTLRTKLNGRWVKKPAAMWSEPVRGGISEDGIFMEDSLGEVVIRYDRTTGIPHCLNHQVTLEECRGRHI